MTTSAEIILAEVVTEEETSARDAARPVPSIYLTERQRRTRIFWLMVFGAIYLISFTVSRANLPHVPLCWFHAMTGLSCPTCGLTRAFTEIGHGNFAAATELNLMAIPVFLVGLALAAALAHEILSYRNWLAPWIGHHHVALLLIAASSVLLRYAPYYLAL
jgi:hypothetical protein